MKINRYIYSITITASILIITLVYLFYQEKLDNSPTNNSQLGSCKSPQEAFKETQQALQLLSVNINYGIKNAKYINEYENVKNKIFKNEKK